jgi:hypothetical protein
MIKVNQNFRIKVWSSTEGANYNAWGQVFIYGLQYDADKHNDYYYVRAVRAFKKFNYLTINNK